MWLFQSLLLLYIIIIIIIANFYIYLLMYCADKTRDDKLPNPANVYNPLGDSENKSFQKKNFFTKTLQKTLISILLPSWQFY